jgi:diguanylate cyclase
MNYSDSIELSTRLLKQAIVLMARQTAALHPISYAVWYEYVAGTNPGLNSEIERLTANGGHLDELQTLDLYSRFIGGLRQEEAKQLQERFLEILKQMSHSAAEVDRRATAYGTVLEDFGSELATASSANAAQAGIDWVLSQTREMQASVQVLKESLDHSKQEAENLRAELFKARREAQVDALTGLTNRRGLDDVLRERIAEASPETAGLSVAVLDLDHFKSVNDTYGHPFGDRVIQSVAEIIRSNIKGKDTAARFGGEEFVLAIPHWTGRDRWRSRSASGSPAASSSGSTRTSRWATSRSR